MVTDIITSLGNCFTSLGYDVKYSNIDKGNSTKLPLAEFDIKTTSVAVYQTEDNINKLDFDVFLYHKQLKTDSETVSSLSTLTEFETIKKTLNQSLKAWNIQSSMSIPGHYGLTWSYQGQGINKEFAQNLPVKMFVLSCSLQYTDN